MTTAIVLDELVELFGGLPEVPGGDSLTHWPYVATTFRADLGDVMLELTVDPGHEEAHFLVFVAGRPVNDLSLSRVRRITVERIQPMEALRLHFHDEAGVLHVRLRPSVLIVWPTGTGEAPDP